jgi:hypothetical protein
MPLQPCRFGSRQMVGLRRASLMLLIVSGLSARVCSPLCGLFSWWPHRSGAAGVGKPSNAGTFQVSTCTMFASILRVQISHIVQPESRNGKVDISMGGVAKKLEYKEDRNLWPHHNLPEFFSRLSIWHLKSLDHREGPLCPDEPDDDRVSTAQQPCAKSLDFYP